MFLFLFCLFFCFVLFFRKQHFTVGKESTSQLRSPVGFLAGNVTWSPSPKLAPSRTIYRRSWWRRRLNILHTSNSDVISFCARNLRWLTQVPEPTWTRWQRRPLPQAEPVSTRRTTISPTWKSPKRNHRSWNKSFSPCLWSPLVGSPTRTTRNISWWEKGQSPIYI